MTGPSELHWELAIVALAAIAWSVIYFLQYYYKPTSIAKNQHIAIDRRVQLDVLLESIVAVSGGDAVRLLLAHNGGKLLSGRTPLFLTAVAVHPSSPFSEINHWYRQPTDKYYFGILKTITESGQAEAVTLDMPECLLRSLHERCHIAYSRKYHLDTSAEGIHYLSICYHGIPDITPEMEADIAERVSLLREFLAAERRRLEGLEV